MEPDPLDDTATRALLLLMAVLSVVVLVGWSLLVVLPWVGAVSR